MLGHGAGQAIEPGGAAGYADVSKDLTGDYGAGAMFEIGKRSAWRLAAPNRYAAPRASMVNIENYTGVMYVKQLAPMNSGSQNQNGILRRLRSSYLFLLPRPGS